MSDNRNYAVGMKNQGGAPVYMEDLKLSERSAVPNAASIANLKFLLTTGDDEGFRTAIKSYIDESIRAALGPLVNNLDKGTAISRILGTDSNNDLGSITPSNLANVLGGNGLSIIVDKGELLSRNQYYPCYYGTVIKWTVSDGLRDYSVWLVLEMINGGYVGNIYLALANNIDQNTHWKTLSTLS